MTCAHPEGNSILSDADREELRLYGRDSDGRYAVFRGLPVAELTRQELIWALVGAGHQIRGMGGSA